MKNQNRFTIQVKKGNNGLDVFLNTGAKDHYIVTRRSNDLLRKRLSGGISIGELKRAKPRSSRSEQKYYECTRYLLRVVNDFINHELVA